MITSDDVFKIPCSRDTIRAGINYALITHAKRTQLYRKTRFSNIHQSIGEFVTRLALIHLLTQNKISYSMIKTLPFSQPALRQIVVNGWRWCVHANYISKDQFYQVHSNSMKEIENPPVLVSVRKLNANHQQNSDIHIFAILTTSQTTKQREKLNSVYCYIPNHKWHSIRRWTTLSPFVLINKTTQKISVQIGGMDKSRTFKTSDFVVNPGKKMSIENHYYAITHFLTYQKPKGTIELESSGLNLHEVIPSHKWINCWVDIEQSIFFGYCTHEDFQKHAYTQSKGTNHPTFGRLTETYWALSAEHLFPLTSLLSHTKNWQSEIGR